MALKLPVQALKSSLKLTCEYELTSISYQNTKDIAAKDDGSNYIELRLPLVIIFRVIVYKFKKVKH